ncbi:RICIN domain-containing protein [Pseudomonas indica]|uniref:RICIN domain-containing protein n=1 Tax=Pseudomonas indica TaxID=137658 RepID=UPI0023F7A1E0|nr:RICIN domain-containing protein [Pseudomonas indica]MBU3057480.1 RICIN domain-containing protein [Pseudomonas indica]
MLGNGCSFVKSTVIVAGQLAAVVVGGFLSFTANAANCTFMPVSGKVYNIVNEASGMYLDVANGSKENNANVIQWPANGGANQRWLVTDLGNGAWSIRPTHSNKSMDVYGWYTVDGSAIKQWDYYGNPNQQWRLVGTSSGAFTIVSELSKKLVTVADKSRGSAIYQNADTSSANQRWYFNPVDGDCAASSANGSSFSKSFMGSDKVLIGGAMADETSLAAPFYVRYHYVHSEPAASQACYDNCDNACSNQTRWWGCWSASQWNTEPGLFVSWWRDHVNTVTGQDRAQIKHWTWYSLRDLGEVAGYPDGPTEVNAVNDAQLLKRYLDDFRFFLQQIGDSQTMVHLEPDFWGYVRANNANPHAVPAQVTAANSTDCAQEENSAAGLASCLISMTRKYAPNSTVGIHVSCWDYNMEGKPQQCAQFYKDLGASKGDFLVTDASDRDAGWYEVNGNPHAWWDDKGFAAYMDYIKVITEGVGKPMVIWQIPLGNMAMGNTYQHYQDNKLDYFFSHMSDVADAHVVALLFGAGHDAQTTPETDGGHLIEKTNSYWQSGGVSLR